MTENSNGTAIEIAPTAKEPIKSETTESGASKDTCQRTQRTLKIEESGDRWKRQTRPKIRLEGRWLQKAGFPAGNRVTVSLISEGIIELRCGFAGTAPEIRSTEIGSIE